MSQLLPCLDLASVGRGYIRFVFVRPVTQTISGLDRKMQMKIAYRDFVENCAELELLIR